MMNNAINEIKNSLEGINSRITEAEERISDREDKIVEMTTAKQNKEKKKWKELRTVSKTSGTTLNPPTFELKGSLKRKKIGTGKIFEEIIVENFPNMGKEIVTQVQEAQSPIQDKP